MASLQAAGNRQGSRWGGLLATIGLAALIADLAFLATPVSRLIERAHNGVIGVVPSIGMSFLSAARAIAFHEVDYFSLVARILVLFSAMVAVIVGLVLTRRQSTRTLSSRQMRGQVSRERESQ